VISCLLDITGFSNFLKILAFYRRVPITPSVRMGKKDTQEYLPQWLMKRNQNHTFMSYI